VADPEPDLLRPDEGPAFARARTADGERLLIGAVRLDDTGLHTTVPVAVAQSWLDSAGPWPGEAVLISGERLAIGPDAALQAAADADGYVRLAASAPVQVDWDLARVELRRRP
jgi:hypothetical protein